MQKKQQQMEYLSIWTVIFVVFISTWSPIWNGDAVEKIALLYNFYHFHLLSLSTFNWFAITPTHAIEKIARLYNSYNFLFLYLFTFNCLLSLSLFFVSSSFLFPLDPQSEKGMQLRKLWRCSKRLTYPISSFGRKMWK